MWYEILPAAIIITAAMSLPAFGMYGIHKLVLGNGNRRIMEQRFDRLMYQRDNRITGCAYQMNGLESIPDSEN